MRRAILSLILVVSVIALSALSIIRVFQGGTITVQIDHVFRNYDPSPSDTSIRYSLWVRFLGATVETIIGNPTFELFVDGIMIEEVTLREITVRPLDSPLFLVWANGRRNGVDFVTHSRDDALVLAGRSTANVTISLTSNLLKTSAAISWTFPSPPPEIDVWGKVNYSGEFKGIGETHTYYVTFDDGISPHITSISWYYDAGTGKPIYEFRGLRLSNGVEYSVTLTSRTNPFPQAPTHLCDMGTVILYNEGPATFRLSC